MILCVHTRTPFSWTSGGGNAYQISALDFGTMIPIVIRLPYNAMQTKLDAYQLWMVITICGLIISVLENNHQEQQH